jgi:site-specific DNA-adenine methylase
MAYAGNKRKEVPQLYPLLNMNNIKFIVEPYAGSCAFSYYVSLQMPNLTYILNDNNYNLKKMFDIIMDDQLLSDFENEINSTIDTIKNKEDYLAVIKKDTMTGWFIKNKCYSIRPGLYPISGKFTHIIMKSYPIVNFFKNNKIIFTCDDAINKYEEYKNNTEAIIFLDPPYINTCNVFYENANLNIYEYLFNNPIENEKAAIYLILEHMWIIHLLFKKNKTLLEYDKKYEISKKKTSHIIITNH